jgi:hypothetical protein
MSILFIPYLQQEMDMENEEDNFNPQQYATFKPSTN